MMTVVFFAAAVVSVVFGAYLVIAVPRWLERRAERMAKSRRFWAEYRADIARIEARIKASQEKVQAAARHFLSGSDWRDPAGKAEFVKALYGEEVPQYLWYAMPELCIVAEEWEELMKFFWGENGPTFGDCEPHFVKGIGRVLRIRDPRQFAAEIVVGGQACPLYQIGCYDFFGEPKVGAADFIQLYEEMAAVAA